MALRSEAAKQAAIILELKEKDNQKKYAFQLTPIVTAPPSHVYFMEILIEIKRRNLIF